MTMGFMTNQYIAMDRALTTSHGIIEFSKVMACTNSTFDISGEIFTVETFSFYGLLSNSTSMDTLLKNIVSEVRTDLTDLVESFRYDDETSILLGLRDEDGTIRVWSSWGGGVLALHNHGSFIVASYDKLNYFGDPKHLFRKVSKVDSGVSASYDEWGMRPEFNTFTLDDAVPIPEGYRIIAVNSCDVTKVSFPGLRLTGLLFDVTQDSLSTLNDRADRIVSKVELLSVLNEVNFFKLLLSDGTVIHYQDGSAKILSYHIRGDLSVNGRNITMGEISLMRAITTRESENLYVYDPHCKRWCERDLLPRGMTYSIYPDEDGNLWSGFFKVEDTYPIGLHSIDGVETHTAGNEFKVNVEDHKQRMRDLFSGVKK